MNIDNSTSVENVMFLPSTNTSFGLDDSGNLESFTMNRSLNEQTDYKVKYLRTEIIKNPKRHIEIKMYTVEGNEDFDIADITVFGGSTPPQLLTSERQFIDCPYSGKATLLAIAPNGKKYIHSLNYDRVRRGKGAGGVWLGKNWALQWIVSQGETFRFFEICNPRFIDSLPEQNIPVGEDGILSLEN